MTLPILGPAWLPAWLLLYAGAASVIWTVGIRRLPLGLGEARWVAAACFGAAFAALLAPSPWIAALLLGLTISIPVSILTFQRCSDIAGHPIFGAATLLICSTWVAALGILTASLHATQTTATVLAGLLILAGYNTIIGCIQVARGVPCIVWMDKDYGEVGTPVRVPTAFLHNTWKPAAINAILLPVALAFVWPLGAWAPVWGLLLLAMLWQLRAADGETCLVAGLAGLGAMLLALGFILPVVVAAPLGLVAYPSIRARVLANSRLEAWRVAWISWRRSGWLGAGLGAWWGLQVQTPKEPGRRWHSAHNDWLETLVDCGPLPVLCALAYLGSAVVRVFGGVSPLAAGLFGSLVALAVLSVGYMPWRTWPINLVALGIVACWEALAR